MCCTSQKHHSETNLASGKQSSHGLICFPLREGDYENELLPGNLLVLPFA